MSLANVANSKSSRVPQSILAQEVTGTADSIFYIWQTTVASQNHESQPSRAADVHSKTIERMLTARCGLRLKQVMQWLKLGP